MPYEFPDLLTGDTKADINNLWETLWMLVERLNLNEESLKELLNTKEDKQ